MKILYELIQIFLLFIQYCVLISIVRISIIFYCNILKKYCALFSACLSFLFMHLTKCLVIHAIIKQSNETNEESR